MSAEGDDVIGDQFWPAPPSTLSPYTSVHFPDASSNPAIVTRGTSINISSWDTDLLDLKVSEDTSKLSSQRMRTSPGLWENSGYEY